MAASDVDFPSDLRALESEYELIRELGQGGMAAVYLARHRGNGRLVAIKAIRARYLDDPDAIKRFAREARTVAGLDHPNIVRTESIQQIDDRAVAIIMEHVPGGTVRDRLREYGSLGAEDTESILRDVANALGYAHRRGIVHRDVKPENIFLDPTRRRALLSDFGIARRIDNESGITLLGAALGTPQYMSPEQIDGEMVDGRTDIYSLGVLGWELLTGRRPWAGESLYGIIYKQKHEELPRITSLRPRVPANLLFAIEGALIKDKQRRWQSVDEFLDQLTYNPPPLLSQTYPPGAAKGDYAATVEFRSAVAEPGETVGTAEGSVELADGTAAVGPEWSAEAEAEPRAEPETENGSEAEVDATERTLISPQSLAAAAAAAPATVRDMSPRDQAPHSSFSGGEYVLPDFDPGAAASFEFPRHRKRVFQVVGLLVPLGVAAASLFVLLSGSARQSTRLGSTAITSSAGSVVGDSIAQRRADTDSDTAILVPASKPQTAPEDSTAAQGSTLAARPSPTRSAAKPRKAPTPSSTRAGAPTTTTLPGQRVRADSNRSVAAVRAPGDSSEATRSDANGSKGATETIDDPFKIPASARDAPATLGSGAVPSPRCRLASSADQQVCLAAYIAIGDAPLNRVFNSLVDEMRRVAHAAPGAPDPPTVQRVRIEHRAWMSVRDSECPRTAPMGAGPFWAEAQAGCFSEMATARAAELRDAVRRLERR